MFISTLSMKQVEPDSLSGQRETAVCSNCPQTVLPSLPKDTANSQEQEPRPSQLLPSGRANQISCVTRNQRQQGGRLAGEVCSSWLIFLGPTAHSLF